MTPRRRAQPRTRSVSASDVPALADFARGYLHQDLLVEHGSAIEAARAFGRDASADERRALAADLTRVAAAAAHWRASRLERWFRDELRAAWTPSSVAELELIRQAVDAPR